MASVHCWLRLLKIAAPFTPKQHPDDANSANSAPPGLEGGVLKQMQRLALVALVTLVKVWMWGREGRLKATHQHEGKEAFPIEWHVYYDKILDFRRCLEIISQIFVGVRF